MTDSILLYRYMGAESAIKTIERRKLRVGRIKEFNDPFEWKMGIEGIVPEGEDFAEFWMESFVDDRNGKYGIICFSDILDDPVLWAHYADSHCGVAFEFDHLIDPETLHKVQYSDKRPVMDANRLHRPDELNEYLLPLLKQMIFQKASSWSYESEYRVHIDLNECEISGGQYFRDIPNDFLKRVILGYRCTLEELYVRKALDHVGLKDTQVVRAKMDQHTYKIRC